MPTELLQNLYNAEMPSADQVSIPTPETIMQFGTGSLFRKLHKVRAIQGVPADIKNGRVILISAVAFKFYDPAISRILSAQHKWKEIILCACNPQLNIIISNNKTLHKNVLKDKITSNPPFSFPGKLLALLFMRYNFFAGDIKKGMTIFFSNKENDYAATMEAITLELAHLNNLAPGFLDWIENANHFYNIDF